MLKSIMLRNVAVAVIFLYLLMSNFLGYEINFLIVVALIIAAWIISPVAQTFKYLYRHWERRKQEPESKNPKKS